MHAYLQQRVMDQHEHWQREQEEQRTVMQHHIRDKRPIGPKRVDGERQGIDWGQCTDGDRQGD